MTFSPRKNPDRNSNGSRCSRSPSENCSLSKTTPLRFWMMNGKLMGLPLNRALWDEDGLMYDVIAGTFLVVGLGEEDFVSLSPELAQKYEEEFHQPEAFLPLGCCML